MIHNVTRCMLMLAFAGACAGGGIRVNPHWVNVNTSGATTVFLTFGGVTGYTPGESVWCGEVMDAAPDVGVKPVPGTLFGELPARFNLSTLSGTGGFTDIMSIPPSVSRRAYQAAAAGARSTFFYVRHFINTAGGPDEYVAVTCELGSGGARTPFALTHVELAFEDHENIALVHEGGVPPLSASITYTGTGQLQGRWEIVRPGDEPPSERDLLTEATLPLEQRAQQRRFPELGRFSMFLPPTGSVVLPGPDPSTLPSEVNGLYMVLLRIEASRDIEAASDLADAGAGPGEVQAGGVAGFPIPPLRYVVEKTSAVREKAIMLVSPDDLASVASDASTVLSWAETGAGSLYRVVLIDPSNVIVLTALVRPGKGVYRLPPWVWSNTDARSISWSVELLDDGGDVMSKSEWRTLFRGVNTP